MRLSDIYSKILNRTILFVLLIFCIHINTKAQITDSFSDGDFTNNPTWTGDTENFSVTNPHTSGDGSLSATTDGNVLGSNPNTGSSALFVETNRAYGEWRFSATEGRGWAVSSTNDFFIVLISDTNDPSAFKGSLNFNGYYLRFDGSASDKFILYRQQATTKTPVISTDFPPGDDGTSSIPRSFKITREENGLWTLSIDNAWDVVSTTILGSATDNTITNGNYFGIVTNINSPSATRVLWFDNLYCGDIVLDTEPPTVVEATTESSNTAIILFNEPVSSASALSPQNYMLENIGNPAIVSFADSYNNRVKLTFNQDFPLSEYINLIINNIADLSGNIIEETTIPIIYVITQQGDIVINEIFFDQNPPVGLPDYDFLELYNRKNYPISITGWQLNIGTKIVTFPTYTMEAYSYLILCPSSGYDAYSQYGNTLSLISTTDLTNTGREITLRDTDNQLIHTITYDISFYNDPSKEEGGWSIEQIDPDGWCQQRTNWRASIDVSGGTPGRINSVNAPNIDTVPPTINSAWAENANAIKIIFSEEIAQETANNIEKYKLNQDIEIESVEYNATTKNEVTLSLLNNLNEGEEYTLTVYNIEDFCGNKLVTENKEIVYAITEFGSITFNEIMCNPSDQQGLQRYPYIELYNNENHNVSLYQWSLKSGSTNYTLPAITIEPKGFVIIKPNDIADTIQKHVPEIPLISQTFLSKSGKTLELYSSNGTLIHWVSYSNTWYRDEYKKIGGWSLEQIDPTNYCAGYLNWIASNDQRGGTPGETNSVSSLLTDNTTPEIICLTVDNDSCISLHFNEPLLFTELLDNTKWSLEPVLTPDAVIANAPMGNIISLIFSTSLQNNVLYTVTPPLIKDCVGNEIEILPVSFQLPQQPIENDIVINEILFNPFNGATEFVELYNKSTAVFALNDIYITKYNKTGELDALKKASDYGHLLYPDDYLVLAKTRRQVYNFYPHVDSLKIVEVTSLPSIPNSSGSVVLLNMEGIIIDQFEYNEKMHSPLLRNVKGVSLERINPNSKTQDNNNWQSAAEANNFATPTYKNSQFNAIAGSNSKFSLSTPIFSPDGDGFDDFLLIKYNFEQSGNSINIKIFDTDGRLVKNLVQNHYAGTEGEIKWDGSDENNKRAKFGPYIIFIEYFDAAGKVAYEKTVVTLAIMK